MVTPSFSEQRGLKPEPKPLPDDQIPPWLREQVVKELQSNLALHQGPFIPSLGDTLYTELRPWIWKVLDYEPAKTPYGGPFTKYIPEAVKICQWWQFYDFCEYVYRFLRGSIGGRIGPLAAESFAGKVNGLFASEGVVWRFRDGRIERVHPPLIAETIEAVPALLQDARFKGADEQFNRALGHLNKRPEPDTENCVKDAVGAIEAVARIISRQEKALLPVLLDKEPFKSGIHPAMREAVKKVYGYRGDAPGVAHGQVGPSSVEIAEAEWALAFSAATIIYLVKKFKTRQPRLKVVAN